MLKFRDFHPDTPNSENSYARFRIYRDILFFIYKTDIVIDLHAAKKIVADRLIFQKERSYPVFCDIRDVHKTMRDYFTNEGFVLIHMVSILVDLLISHAIPDFYLQMRNRLFRPMSLRILTRLSGS